MRKVFESASSVCFLVGDIFSTGFYLLYGEALAHYLLNALSTIIMGVLGGIAGLAGKELYPIIKRAVRKAINKSKKAIEHEELSEKAE